MYLQTNKMTILDSKSIILDEPCTGLLIPVSYNAEDLGTIELEFIDDNNMDVGIISTKADGSIMRIKCYNFLDNFGRFTYKPIELGAIDGKKISIHIWASLIGDNEKVRRVVYSLYLEK